MTRTTAAFAVFAMTFTVVVAASQTPRPQAAPAPPTSTIQGVVVAADTGAPLRLAHVVVIGATGTLKVTSTEADGRFTFVNLPADRYTIGASKPPYIGALAGAKRPARPGSPVVVAAGQLVSDVIVRLPPGAAISGVITNELGQPAVATFVGLRTWQMRGTERVMVNAQAPMSATDERGRYRIAGLPPGDYIVSAMPLLASLQPQKILRAAEVDAALKTDPATITPTPIAPSQSLTVDRYAPSYYPGTPRGEDAVVVTVIAGEDRQNVDFRVERAKSARVEGTVFGADGRPIGGDPRGGAFRLTLRTASSDATFSTLMSATIGPEGRFAFANVMPGTYIASMAMQNGDFLATLVDVNGVDVTGLQLNQRPPIAVRGRLIFDGNGPPPAVGGRLVSIAGAASDAQALAPSVGRTDPAGVFEISRLLPGRYKVGASLSFGASADQLKWSLQSVVVDGRDITDLPLEVGADAAPREIVVTYTDRWQEISGRLQLANGAPATDYAVVVFPADRNHWIYESRRIAIARPGSNGQFTFGGPGPTTLPPGNYLIAAVTDIERGEQFNPAFLAALAQAAIPVVVKPGERKIQDLAVR
ncbi:MAG TPA: carboxypeptidase regulatory-like domain-containing protein [Vicinamibacterales bacterium]|nr:carboxypeptidase regulatory-like domain-containing protein [Vicinamibacterales bacterium]